MRRPWDRIHADFSPSEAGAGLGLLRRKLGDRISHSGELAGDGERDCERTVLSDAFREVDWLEQFRAKAERPLHEGRLRTVVEVYPLDDLRDVRVLSFRVD